ncbi:MULTISPECIES: peroxidase family protein [unclassified Ornithinimicrobium]|uniref:peroxidase family protein n=1 Tax=unclassified Ornithinimicrobium TaxID=2615080 RepID=UPI0038523735
MGSELLLGITAVLVTAGGVALLAYLLRPRWRTVVGFMSASTLVVAPLAVTSLVAPSAAVTETVPTFRLIASDLDFILDQIEISEAHAHAINTNNTSYSLVCATTSDTSGKCVRDPMLPHGLRTVDGSFNNLVNGQTEFGSSNRLMPRLLPIQWRDGDPTSPGSPLPDGDRSMCEAGSSCYEQVDGTVYDSDPRTISNLIVDSSTANPAAVDAAANNAGSTTDPVTGEVFIPNVMPDEGLSAPVNLWFVLFGQFFDHGLDLVNKGGSGRIIVPLNPDDPLYASTPPGQRFMAIDRATNQPGPDGVLGTGDDVREHENRTTPFVDQNQTYTSHPAHQVFLREYELVGGVPQATGRLLNGQGGGLATWNDVKAQASSVLGITLRDADVLSVPNVVVDLYGNFVPGGNGFPQLVTESGIVEGSAAAPISTVDAERLNQSFLDDIAHGAVPNELAGYDNVLLGEHFITGDGRGNENIGLTAVHHVFHAEHNRLVDHVNAVLNEPGNEVLLAAYQAQTEDDDWSYNERVFQAARFANEMQYQHLVFEEFARTIQPAIDVITFNENSYDSTIDASIKAEFAHVVYRFGHSMLNQDLAREGFGTTSTSLLDGFLNPVAFHCRVQPTAANDCAAADLLTSDEAAGALVNGTTNQAANQTDELVTSTLRNSLLGLPLDLASINIMRGRDAGVPPLQEARRVFFQESGNPNLEPYSSWQDFGFALRNGDNFGRGDSQASLINFIAAYGSHPSVVAETTLIGKRAAAEALVLGTATTDLVERIAGANRYATAAALSRSTFAGAAPVVFVANGENFPDALAGGPAAKVEGGPLLLVGTNTIPSDTALELARLQPAEIVVLGGPNVVTDQVANSLATYTTTDTVTRVSGFDRYETAAQVSQRGFPTGATTAYVASGLNFPDALSGGAAAAFNGAPLLLVNDGLPAATANELTRLGVTDIKVLGGPVAVNEATATALGSFGTVERISGDDRYATSVAISQDAFADNIGGTIYLATGLNFPDALSAAPTGSPLLLVPGTSTALPAATAAEILRLNPARVVILGGEVAVTAGIEQAVEALFPAPVAPADRIAFLQSTGAWQNVGGQTVTGLEEVDFWVGGLAEALDPFGGMLGTTFNYVFETQLENLQFGDRFYYLFRNQGNQLFAALEANSFSSLIQRNTDASLLPAAIFSLAEPSIDLENLPVPLPAQFSQAPDGTWRWNGDEHIEIHGNRTLADRMQGGQGDDSLFGYGGNDRIEGGSGNDSILGGPGDDILTDSFGDDNIKGGDGNDAIDGGPGVDLLLAGAGNDFVSKPLDNSDGATAFLGTGNDIFIGGPGRETPFGNEGDDWLEGLAASDLLIGDNSQQFQNDVDGGDDVLIGGAGSDDMDAEGGDDILVGGPGGTDRFHGMFGFDHVTFYGTSAGIDADMNFNLQPPDVTAIRDRYLQTESLSGGSGNDVLRGLGFVPDAFTGTEVNWLTEEGLDLVDGLRTLLQPSPDRDFAARFMTSNAAGGPVDGNLLMGGSGSDLIEGRTGDDFIDGDAYLRVQLLHVPSQVRYDSAAQVRAAIFAGTMNPGDFEIVREIAVDPNAGDDVDTAEYLLNRADVEIVDEGDGYYRLTSVEGEDILHAIEQVEFVDGCVVLATGDACVAPAALNATASGGEIVADLELAGTVAGEVQFTLQELNGDGSWVPVTGAELESAGPAQTIPVPEGTQGDLRVVATYVDGEGVLQGSASEVLPGG